MTSLSDANILAAIPDCLSIPGMLKAVPVEEDGRRILYIEASNESVDRQDEVILQKALAESSDFYLRHGNIDLQHITIMGLKAGIPNYQEFEIGRPVAVSVSGAKTFVKSELYAGDTPMGRNASLVWDSITKQVPAARWYPSVGGSVLSKSIRVDPKTGARIGVVDKVRWSNIGLTRTPVNGDVPEVSAAPIGVFAKAFDGWVMKDLTAGYGTDSASLTGGAALRKQSIYGAGSDDSHYHKMRDRLAADVQSGAAGDNPTSADLRRHLMTSYGLSDDDAGACVTRFMGDLKSKIKRSN